MADARESPGALAVFKAADLNGMCPGWTGHLGHFPGMIRAPQSILAQDELLWAGHPVAMVVARSRAQAEDACELSALELYELAPASSVEAALDPQIAPAISTLESNLCYRNELKTDGVAGAFARAALIVEGEYQFGRHTAVTTEPRAIVGEFDPSTGQLDVHHGTQTPFQFQDIYARQFGLPDNKVRVISPDAAIASA